MKILVLGANGMIGHRMWATLTEQGHQVFGLTRISDISPFTKIPGISLESSIPGIDVRDYEKLNQIIKDIEPHFVLNCVGIIKQVKASNIREETIELNALFPHKLSEICKNNGAKMIQFSTDCVFDGIDGDYNEACAPNALDLYGQTKALGEVLDKSHVITFRLSCIGRELNFHGGLVEWVRRQENKSISGFSQALYTGFSTQSLALILDKYFLNDNDLHGIIHLSSSVINKYDLLNLINEKYSLNIDIKPDPSVVIKRNLNSESIKSKLNISIPSWNEMIADLSIDWDIYEEIYK